MSIGDGIGSFLSGVSSGANVANKQDQAEKLDQLIKLQQQSAAAAAVTPPASSTPAAPAAPGSATPAPSGSDAKPVSSTDPVATDLAPHARAFLNAVSDGESGGKYNIRYTPSGGTTFDDFSQHPGIMETTADGKKSSAAGRYEFTKTTWNGLGGGDFSPANQDHRAWQLAQSDYKARTGGDLDAELQAKGITPQIMSALKPTWASFGSNQDRHTAAYNDSMARFALPASRSVQPAATTDQAGGKTAMQIMGDLYPASKSIM